MAARRDIHIDAGATDRQVITFDATQAAYTFEAFIEDYDGYGTNLDYVVTQNLAVVTCVLSATDSALLDPSKLYVWKLVRTGTDVEVILRGFVIVR
jgi:hypothetical protein